MFDSFASDFLIVLATVSHICNKQNNKKKIFNTFVIIHIIIVDSFIETNKNRIGGMMVTVFTLSAVYRGPEPLPGQTKDYKIGIRYFFAKHAALRRKSKDRFARNQNNASEWSDMSIHGPLFQ